MQQNTAEKIRSNKLYDSEKHDKETRYKKRQLEKKKHDLRLSLINLSPVSLDKTDDHKLLKLSRKNPRKTEHNRLVESHENYRMFRIQTTIENFINEESLSKEKQKTIPILEKIRNRLKEREQIKNQVELIVKKIKKREKEVSLWEINHTKSVLEILRKNTLKTNETNYRHRQNFHKEYTSLVNRNKQSDKKFVLIS